MNLEPKRLYRSRTDRMVGGVCAGIAEYLNVDPTIIRLLFVLLAFVTGFTWLIVYIAMLLIVPEAPGYAAPVAPSTPAAPAPAAPGPEETNL